MARELSHRRWQDFRRRVLEHYPPVCHLCGKAIDLTLPGTVPQGPTVDHVVPRSKGGRVFDLNNCRPAHKSCNSGKKDRVAPRRPQSRQW